MQRTFMPDVADLVWAYTWSEAAALAKIVSREAIPLIILPEDDTSPYNNGTACTDGDAIYFSHGFWEHLNQRQRAAVYWHECLHIVLRHPWLHQQWSEAGHVRGRKLYEPYVQLAFDAIINPMVLTIKPWLPAGHYAHPRIDWRLSEADAYCLLYDECPPPDDPAPGSGSPPAQEGKDGSQPAQGGSDVLPANPSALEETIEASVGQFRDALGSLLTRGTQAGDAAEMLERLSPSRINWRQYAKARVRKASGRERATFARFRSSTYATGVAYPKRYSHRSGFIVVQGDTSGSVGTEQLHMFAGAVPDIFRACCPQRLMWMQTDHAVQSVVDITSLGQLQELIASGEMRKIKGRGGTSMVCGFDWLREHELKPDLIITLTDGYTDWPKDITPAKSALWMITTRGIKAPDHAGESVYMDPDR